MDDTTEKDLDRLERRERGFIVLGIVGLVALAGLLIVRLLTDVSLPSTVFAVAGMAAFIGMVEFWMARARYLETLLAIERGQTPPQPA